MTEKCLYRDCQRGSLQGEQYCIFHAPVDRKGCSVGEFTLSVYQELRHRGGGNFEGCVFPDAIDFDGHLNHPPFVFKDARFHGHVNFARQSFREEVNFDNAVFEDGVSFKSAHFPKDVSFKNTVFSKPKATDAAFNPCIDCTGTTFEGQADFSGARFLNGDAEFREAKFLGIKAVFKKCRFDVPDRISFLASEFNVRKANFDEAYFAARTVDFEGCKFHKGWVSFYKAILSADRVKFNGARFSGEVTSFMECQFLKGRTSFESSVFAGKADFNGSKLGGSRVYFAECQFEGNTVSFDSAELVADRVAFYRCRFSGNVEFYRNSIGKYLRFREISFSERAAFRLSRPTFSGFDRPPPRIVLSHINFNPFSTIFENVHPTGNLTLSTRTVRSCVVFRYCSLKDVYFSNNDMGLFSFFGSVFFEESHLVSNEWLEVKEPILRSFPIRYERRNLILEENLYDALNDEAVSDGERRSLRVYFKLHLLRSRRDVESMYRKLKTSSDRSKDYHAASWFYFNEFEMKRRHLKDCRGLTNGRGRKLAISGRLWLYSSFKLFAGYGDKPVWSLAWFGAFTVLFSVLHLLRGVQVPAKGSIDYDLAWDLPNLQELISDFGYSFLFSLYHIIPVSYLPYQRGEYVPLQLEFSDLALAFCNTVVLLILVVFIGVGLKRHFRRF